MLSQGGAAALPPKLVAVSLAVVTCAAGGTFAVTRAHRPPAPAASVTVSPPPSHAASAVPLVTHTAGLKPSAPPARKPSPPPPAPVTVSSERKGVSA